jgi:hypothetical protein
MHEIHDKAVCPWCGHTRALKKDGTLVKHGFEKNLGGSIGHRPKACEGSGRKPALTNENAARPVLRLRTSIV